MDTKEQIESIVFHQAQCITALEDLKGYISNHMDGDAINKLKDLEKELTRLAIQLRNIESHIEEPVAQ